MSEFVGRYQLVDKIGAGGMGVVYRARDSRMRRDVALKLLPRHLTADPHFVERFNREAQSVGQLEHPHIIPVYDAGEDDGRPYIVMRLLTGGELRDRLHKPGFGTPELLDVLRKVASALDVAHARRIIHRDLKPSNILFDEIGTPFLADFGIAKVLDAATQLTGAGMVGTPAYMSPEQFTAESEVSAQSDQYSLAVVVFEALSGRLPFSGDTTAQVMFRHISEKPPDLHMLDHRFPPALSAVLNRALAKKPADRYPTVTAFVDALSAVAQQNPATVILPIAPLATSEARPSPPPSQPSAAQVAATTLAVNYQEGLEAMHRGDWASAVDAFDRVTTVDRNYRSALKLKGEAEGNLAERQRAGAAAAAAAAAAAVSHQTAAAPAGLGRDAQAGATEVLPSPAAAPATSPYAQPAAAPPYQPAPAKKRSAMPLVIGAGIVILLLLGLVGGAAGVYYVFFSDGSSADTATMTPTVAVAEVTVDAGEAGDSQPPAQKSAAIAVAGRGARVRRPGQQEFVEIKSGDEVSLEPGMALQSGSEPMSLQLSDGSDLVLADNVTVEVPEPGSIPSDSPEGESTILLGGGRVVYGSDEEGGSVILIVTRMGKSVRIAGGLAGVRFDEGGQILRIDCFAGDCRIGEPGNTLVLTAGQASQVGSSGAPSAPEAAQPNLFCDLAPGLIACEEATETPTPTETATGEASATATEPAATETPVPTSTRVPPTNTVAPPTNTVAPPTNTAVPPTQPPPTQPPPTQPPPPTDPPPPTEPPPPTDPPPDPPTLTPEPP